MPVFFTSPIARLEYSKGHTIKQLPRASPDLCTPLLPGLLSSKKLFVFVAKRADCWAKRI